MTHAMHGVPWTPAKMRAAVQKVQKGGSVSFSFGTDPLDCLRQLDGQVFALRPDLNLHISPNLKGAKFTEAELETVASLEHVRGLEVSASKQARLSALGALRHLERLTLRGSLPDVEFVGQLPALTQVFVCGAAKGLDSLGTCSALEQLHIQSAAVPSLAFIESLPRLHRVTLDGVQQVGGLEALTRLPALEVLQLSEIKELVDVDFIAALARVESLTVRQSRVVKLPDLSGLERLTELQLHLMKAWTNPEVMATLPCVERIKLEEINTKLKAERFFFLAEMGLSHLDIEFLDFNKGRIEAITAHFARLGKSAQLA